MSVSSKSLDLPINLAPSPPPMQCCSNCGQVQALWKLGKDKEAPTICSLCVFYESRWSESNSDGIADFILRVGKLGGHVIEMTIDGRLANCRQADQLLAGIAVENQARKYGIDAVFSRD